MTTTIDNPTTNDQTTNTDLDTITFAIDCDAARAFAAGSLAASNDQARPTIGAVCLTVKDGTVHQVCTDSYRLNLTAATKHGRAVNVGTVTNVLIPAKWWRDTLKKAASTHRIMDMVPITLEPISPERYTVTIGNVTIGQSASPTLDSSVPFPKWVRLMPGDVEWYGNGNGDPWPDMDTLNNPTNDGQGTSPNAWIVTPKLVQDAVNAQSTLATGRRYVTIRPAQDPTKPFTITWQDAERKAGITLIMPVRPT